MALLKFLKGNYSSLSNAAINEGQILICGDTGEMFVDVASDKRVKIGDFVVMSDIAALEALDASTVPTSRLYYVENGNILARSNGTSWIQINKQKTLAELGGVSKTTYDEKVAALAKADTDNATATSNLSNYVGTFTHATAKTVVEYINAKTDGIATSGNLEALGTRVTTAEGEIDALQAAIAEGGSVTTAIATAKAAGDNAQSAVDTLSGKVGTVEDGKTVVGMIEAVDELADQGIADAATAQARADEAYNLADGKATMEQVNAAIAGAGHAVKTEVDTAIENLDKAYKEADVTLQGNIDKKVDQTAYDAKIAELAGADTAMQGSIDAITGKVGTVPEGKTVVEMIAEAQTAATYDDTKVKEDIKANADAIDVIEADYLKAADKTELSNAIAGEKTRAEGIESGLRTDVDAIKADYLKASDKTELQNNINTVSNAVELLTNGVSANEVDGVNDLIQYVKEHGTEVTGMKEDIQDNADAIAAINDESTGILKQAKDYADEEIEKLNIGQYAKQADVDAAIEAAKADASNKDAVVLAEAQKGINAVETALNTYKTENNAAVALKADASTVSTMDAAYKAADTALSNRIKDLEDNKAGYATTGQVATAKQEAIDAAQGKVDALANGQVKTNKEAIEAINDASTGLLKQAKDYADGLADNYADADHDHVVADITDFDEKVKAYGYATTTYADNKASAAQSAAEATAASALASTKTELEGKITSGDSATLASAQAYADQAELDAIAAAKTETENQVKTLADGQVATNKTDIASLFAQMTWGSF